MSKILQRPARPTGPDTAAMPSLAELDLGAAMAETRHYSIPYRNAMGEIEQTAVVRVMSAREAAITREIHGPGWVRLPFSAYVVAIKIER